MIIYFCDRDLNILGNASTQLPDGFRITDDLTVEEIDTGVNTFSCVLPFTEYDRADLEPMVAEGNYVLKQSAGGDADNVYDSVYQIIDVECDTSSQEYSIYAEDAGLDLLNTLCPAVTLTGTIGQMMQYFLPSNWTLNLMDVPTTTQTNTWDGESTCTERLLSVANLWGCELYYSFVIDRLQIVDRVVNVIEKRGNQEAIPQLRLNYDLKKIYWKKSIADLVTALNVTGGTPEGSDTPINLVGYNYSYTDPSTGEVYRVDTATGQMRNETAMAKWSSAIDPDGLWVGSFSFDTTDKATLAGQARAHLQRHSQVEVNYEVDFEKLPDDIQIGDRVNIIDEDGELYLEARLLRIGTCEAEDTQTATIGEYLLRDGGISARVAQLATDLANARATDKVIQSQMQIITDTVDNMFTLEVDSDVVLAQAYLTARLLQGNKDVKTNYDPNWFKWILRSENGERLLGRGYTYTADMSIIGYASTILCRFIRPQVYDLTDHNNVAITDANLDPIQVSFAGIYNQPVVTRNLLKSRLKTLRATPTVEVGDPNLTKEVNLYERGTVNATVQRFWVAEEGEDAGVHITEIPKEEWLENPSVGGGNLLARSNGIKIRDGLTDLAQFADNNISLAPRNGSASIDLCRKKLEITADQYREAGTGAIARATLENASPNYQGHDVRISGSTDRNTTSGNFTSRADITTKSRWGGSTAEMKVHSELAGGEFGYDKESYIDITDSSVSLRSSYQSTKQESELFALLDVRAFTDSSVMYLKADTITSSVAIQVGSDRRLKEHQNYLGNEADDFIRNLKPAFYLKDGKNHTGFYAQDVAEIDKWDCMTGESRGYMTLSYMDLIAPLVAYCQHLEKRIEELEKGSK